MDEKLLTVHQVADLTGITIRTLHYYDEIGLLKPSQVTKTRYRLYNNNDLVRLQEILFYREVGFTLKDIKRVITSKQYNRHEALKNHLQILQAQKERLDGIIKLVDRELQGTNEQCFSAFSSSKIQHLQAQFRQEIIESWGETDSFREFEAVYSKSSRKKQQEQFENLLSTAQSFFERLAMYEGYPSDCSEVQSLVKGWQGYISQHFYRCDRQMLRYLGKLYVSDERFSEFINRFGKGDLAQFFNEAIRVYCSD